MYVLPRHIPSKRKLSPDKEYVVDEPLTKKRKFNESIPPQPSVREDLNKNTPSCCSVWQKIKSLFNKNENGNL